MAAKVNGGFTTAIAVTSGVPEQTGELQLLAAATDTEAAQTYTPAADATLVLDASNRSGGGLAGAMTIAMEERLSGAAGAWAATMTTSPAQNWSAIVVGFTPAGLTDGAFDDASFDANSFWTGPVAPTGQTVVLGLAVETDSSSPITKTKRRSLGQAAETDTSATIAKKKARALSQATETDTASTITKRKARLLALALETDSTFPLTVRVPTVVVLGQALETDTPQPVTKAKRRTVALAQETDLGLAVTKVKRRTIPLAQETDLGLTATRRKTRTLGQATEANTSSAVTKRKQRTVGQAVETDTGFALALRRKLRTLTQATETDTASTITKRKLRTVNQALETDTAAPVVLRSKLRTLGITIESDTALGIGKSVVRLLGLATENDAPLALLRRAKVRALGQAVETDVAQPLKGFGIKRLLGLVTETDTPFALVRNKAKQLGLTTETDTPFGKQISPGIAGTLDFESFALGTLGPALSWSAFYTSTVSNANDLVVDATHVHSGTKSLLWNIQVATGASAHAYGGRTADNSVQGEDIVEGQLWVWPSRTMNLQGRFDIHGPTGTFLAFVAGSQVSCPAGQWSLLTVRAAMPATAMRVLPTVQVPGATLVGDQIWIDNISVSRYSMRLKKTRLLGQILESNIAQALLRRTKLRRINLAQETDLGLVLKKLKRLVLGQTTEEDTAFPLKPLRFPPVEFQTIEQSLDSSLTQESNGQSFEQEGQQSLVQSGQTQEFQ
ncbi:MAG TPA: hypothetical protein VM715_04650 [Candidatus Acidoferrum sp.]|nr:hypothetical protein [Candidatus Acidoferrum sp.]